MFILEPKKELTNEPYEIGETFAVPVSLIMGASIAGEAEGPSKLKFLIDDFQWTITLSGAFNCSSDVKDMHGRLCNCNTLVKYVGNNEFVEYYTNKKLRLSENKIYDVESFIDEVVKLKETPLCVCHTVLKPVTDTVRSSILSNDEVLISNYLNMFEDEARVRFNERFDEIAYSDYEWASKEDRLYTFEKSKKRR